MPSKKCYEVLIKQGIRVDKSKFDSLDCLENSDDLNKLGEVLNSLKSVNGSKPIITFNTVMGNPDFERIEQEEFINFYVEPFQDSYRKYYGESNMHIWQSLIENKLMQPQFHAREHLNSDLWIQDLQDGHQKTCLAFRHRFFGLKTRTSHPHQEHYLSAYHIANEKDLERKISILKEGLKTFEELFGFISETFIGCNYVWPNEIEKPLKNLGVEVLQGQRGHIVPRITDGATAIQYHFTGQQNTSEQIYTVRNCHFEPFLNDQKDWVTSCINDIQRSFFWRKPAIVSTHRINFVSGMDVKHRDRNLSLLKELLQRIINNWPDVRFLSSDQLAKTILSNE